MRGDRRSVVLLEGAGDDHRGDDNAFLCSTPIGAVLLFCCGARLYLVAYTTRLYRVSALPLNT